MIALSAERLQKQSLEELKCTSFNISLPLLDHTDMAHCGSPLQLAPEVFLAGPDLLSQDPPSGQHRFQLPPLPPESGSLQTRQLLSEEQPHIPNTGHGPAQLGEGFYAPHKKALLLTLSARGSLPLAASLEAFGSKVWTPIKHQDSSGERALEEQPLIPVHGACSFRFDQAPGTSLQCVQSGGGSSPPFFSLALARASPVSMLWESGKTLQPFPLQRRFSLSPVRFLPSPQSSASSTPELLRRQHGLPRSQSQPCDLDTKKSGLKRRHDEDVRWHRPSLNFYKMNQKRFSGGLCFLDKTEESSASSWILACSQQAPSAPCSPISNYGPVPSEEEEEEARSQSWHMGSKRTFFQQDFSDLDLNLIEEN